jgi:hypothetical protein
MQKQDTKPSPPLALGVKVLAVSGVAEEVCALVSFEPLQRVGGGWFESVEGAARWTCARAPYAFLGTLSMILLTLMISFRNVSYRYLTGILPAPCTHQFKESAIR